MSRSRDVSDLIHPLNLIRYMSESFSEVRIMMEEAFSQSYGAESKTIVNKLTSNLSFRFLLASRLLLRLDDQDES